MPQREKARLTAIPDILLTAAKFIAPIIFATSTASQRLLIVCRGQRLGVHCGPQGSSLHFERGRGSFEDCQVRKIALFCLLCLTAGSSFPGQPPTVIWKPLVQAIVLLNDAPPKTWNAYKAEKHDSWILVQLWRRYLFLDLREQAVYDLDPQKFKRKDDTLEWSEGDKPSAPIAISNWDSRNVGTMQRIRFQFGKDGGVLEVQIPEKPNLRSF